MYCKLHKIAWFSYIFLPWIQTPLLLIDFLSACSINYWESITIITKYNGRSISFLFLSICFMYFEALMLGTYTFKVVTSFWWNDTFNYKVTFLIPIIFFTLKIYLIWYLDSHSSFTKLILSWCVYSFNLFFLVKWMPADSVQFNLPS